MPKFNFFEAKPPSLDSAYGNAMSGELARAESRGAWAQALQRAVEMATERNARREALAAEAQLRREMQAQALSSQLGIARMQEAGQDARSQRFLTSQQAAQAENVRQFDVTRGDQQAAIARTQAGQDAFGALATGQGLPQVGPPASAAPGFVGPPGQGPSSFDKAKLLSQLPPQLAMQYMANEAQDHEHALARQAQAEDFGFRTQKQADDHAIALRQIKVAEDNQARQLEADLATKQKSLYEKAIEVVSKNPAFKKPNVNEEGAESIESFSGRFNAEVERVMGLLAQDQQQGDPYAALSGGDAQGSGSPPPSAAPTTAAPISDRGQAMLAHTWPTKLWHWITGDGEKPEGTTAQHEALKRATALQATDPKGAEKILRDAGLDTIEKLKAARGW